jgi:hypothetical protein
MTKIKLDIESYVEAALRRAVWQMDFDAYDALEAEMVERGLPPIFGAVNDLLSQRIGQELEEAHREVRELMIYELKAHRRPPQGKGRRPAEAAPSLRR